MKSLIVLSLIFATTDCTRHADLVKRCDARIAHATNAEERTLRIYEKRMIIADAKGRLEKEFQPADGVDDYEAWLLASAYLPEEVTLCGDIGAPKKVEAFWVISTTVGRESRKGPEIIIEAASGKLTCKGHAAVDDPAGFLLKYYQQQKEKPRKKPNQSLQPTTMSVTDRACARSAPATVVADLSSEVIRR